MRDQLADAVALLPGRQGPVRLLDERAHVDRHGGEVEGRLDEGVIEIEDAQRHAETVSQACYHERVIMTRRLLSISALASILLAGLAGSPALALDEADRLWLVGERAFADGLHPVARRVLDRFVVEYPSDTRAAPALLLLGRSRLALGEPEKALDAFRRVRAVASLPAQQLEARFWEAESLYRLKQFAAARAAYDDVLSKDAASPLAPEALYGLGLCELELRRPEPAIKAFRDLLSSWPEHPTAPSATFYQAQTLGRAQALSPTRCRCSTTFSTKYPKHKLVPDAQYLLGSTRVAMGERDAGVADLQAFVAAVPRRTRRRRPPAGKPPSRSRRPGRRASKRARTRS